MFIGPDHYSYGSLNGFVGPGLLRPLSKYGYSFLVGTGEEPYAIALDGEHAGFFMKVEDGGNHDGMFIGGIDLEVDPSSAYPAGVVQRPKLSVVRHEAGTAIMCEPAQNSFGRNALIPWQGGAFVPGSWQVGFTQWDLVLWVRNERIVLHSHRGEKPAST